MCWSEEVSLMFTIIGIGASAYSYEYINGLWSLSIFYFTIMQLIHYISYLVIDDCNNPINISMTYANYVHVAFQPLFYLLGLYGLLKTYKIINKDQLVSLRYFIYLSVFFGIFYVVRLFPISVDFPLETTGCAWCGPPCATTGKVHVEFGVPLRLRPFYLTPGLFTHFLLFFVPLLLYNTTTQILSIVVAASAAAPSILYGLSPSETGTTWCGISVVQLIVLTMITIYYRK